MSQRDAAKIAVFPSFWQYFSLSALHITGYNTKSQKIHAEKDRKEKIRKSGNVNVFQNLIKIVVNLFGKKVDIFLYTADPEILSYMRQFFNKEGGTRLKLFLQPNFWL